jgi:hypothetical protein
MHTFRGAAVTRDQARALVLERVRAFGPLHAGDEYIVVDEATIEKPWGWVFFHTSRKWKETGDICYAVAGNSPILVEKATGRLLTTGTARNVEYYIENYERTGNPHGIAG